MRYLGLLLIFAIAFSACPNNCNGHGKCNNGVCECFRSSGLESIPDAGIDSSGLKTSKYNLESYYGADCSRSMFFSFICLEMCPLGISFATVRETGYTVDLEAKEVYDTPSPKFNTPVVEVDRRMDDQAVKGEGGMPTAVSTGNGASGVPANHMYVECSGAGLCNEETGICECFEGFEGKACQRMSCPNGCSGKGKCVPINEAVGLDGSNGKDIKDLFGFNGRVKTDSSSSVIRQPDNDGEAKFFGCLCDKGFRGPDCSLRECPSGEDPLKATNVWTAGGSSSPDLKNYEHRDCSGRGKCEYEKGECKCFEGFSGAACSSMNTYM